MGTSSISLFADDTALDVREVWLQQYKDTGSASKATAMTRRELADEFSDSDSKPVAILALAMTLWKHGVLSAPVKRSALRILDRKQGMARWREQGPAAMRKRAAVYVALRQLLVGPMPKVKKYRRPAPSPLDDPELRLHDIFSIPAAGGGRGFFRVIRVDRKRSGRVPTVCMLRFARDASPTAADLAGADFIEMRVPGGVDGAGMRCPWVTLLGWPMARALHHGVVRYGIIKGSRPRTTRAFAITCDWTSLPRVTTSSLDPVPWPTFAEREVSLRRMTAREVLAAIPAIKRDVHRCMMGRYELLVPAHRICNDRDGATTMLPIFELAARLFPKDERSWAGLGECLWRMGRRKRAQACFEKAIELAPGRYRSVIAAQNEKLKSEGV